MDSQEIRTAFIAVKNQDLRKLLLEICSRLGLHPMGFDSPRTLFSALGSPQSGITVLETETAPTEIEKVSRFQPVILIVTQPKASVGAVAARLGVFDLLDAPADADLLENGLRNAKEKSQDYWANFCLRQEIDSNMQRLSNRETQVCGLLLEGWGTKQIASSLEISTSTVEKHRLRVFEKMGVDSVVRLIRLVELKQQPA